MGTQTMKILELEYRGPWALGGVETHVFEISKQFWSFLVEEGMLENPDDFIAAVPHHS